ncbi:MAG TPA: GNAT family N-acetyltransferase [Candidatus Pacearchaeota archaeon]|nr:GNAT family N-acetyltransferase [Candidatus Pacearchaeota archaeon]
MEVKQFSSEKDIESVLDLFIRVMSEYPYEENWTRTSAFKALKGYFQNSEGFCFYAQESDNVIGFVFCIIQVWDDGDHLFVEQTIIDPLYRNKGVGTSLIRKVEKTAKEKGIKSIELMTTKKSSAYEFWKKRGYVFEGYELLGKEI